MRIGTKVGTQKSHKTVSRILAGAVIGAGLSVGAISSPAVAASGYVASADIFGCTNLMACQSRGAIRNQWVTTHCYTDNFFFGRFFKVTANTSNGRQTGYVVASRMTHQPRVGRC